jgi:hypothetical protein
MGPRREPASYVKGGKQMIAALAFFWWLIFVALWFIFLMVTMGIARSKGHSALLWGLLACFLPLITVIIVLLLPDRTRA